MASKGMPILYFAQFHAQNGSLINGVFPATVDGVDQDGNPVSATFVVSGTPPYQFTESVVGRDDTLQTPHSWAAVSFTAKITME